MPITLLHTFTCFAMTGLIWLVQLVLYPLFAYLDPTRWAAAHALHSRRITLIVFPLMTIELLTAGALVMLSPPAEIGWRLLNGIGVLLLWGSTAFVSVPIHNRLTTGGYDPVLIQRLVTTNWIRTLLWSVRSIGWMLWWLLTSIH